jgi:hypothetical protein
MLFILRAIMSSPGHPLKLLKPTFGSADSDLSLTYIAISCIVEWALMVKLAQAWPGLQARWEQKTVTVMEQWQQLYWMSQKCRSICHAIMMT